MTDRQRFPEPLASIVVWSAIMSRAKREKYKQGVLVVDVLDKAEEIGVARHRAADILVEWVSEGKVEKSEDRNRIDWSSNGQSIT
ncbi:hypothetical protein GRX01_07780 [Halobaculum sp. WSA2]|uniref:Uncharacterized protein n=1 Tax=Halobaculum saliterrae TaxID=2073113 RepID=A0A6B0SRF5_9EURY|nr:hypothetical protein [Halobaculum saliterrae]MXR41235.1 hypothetical protein [Halobaculum saliterrae]